MRPKMTVNELSSPCRVLRALILVSTCLCATALFAASAQASEGIESFITTSSTSLAGGHPDLTMSFSLQSPGEPEAAKNVVFDAPQGVFGNTDAITECTAADFALDQCASNSQAGLITVYANDEGNPEQTARHRTDLRSGASGRRNGALLFRRPDP